MKKLLLCSLLMFPIMTFAQKHHEVGVWVGSANYYGDLNKEWVPTSYSAAATYKPAVGILYKYFVNPRLGFRFGASYMNVTAADSISKVGVDKMRNLSFATNIYEAHAGIEINFFKVGVENFKVSPYIFAGIAAYYSDPYTMDDKMEKTYLRSLSTEGQGLPSYPDRQVYPLVNAAFPVGAGMKFFIGKTVLVTAEVGLRYLMNDYLDDVSQTYVNADTLFAYKGQKAVDLSFRGNKIDGWDGTYPDYGHQRGDGSSNDFYWTAGLTVTVWFDAFGNIKEYIQTKCAKLFGK